MTIADQFLIALTAWRENRGGGLQGMQSVANVIVNRAKARNQTPYQVCTARLQFSSITAAGDPNLILYPQQTDSEWTTAQLLAGQAASGTLEDITEGATSYYALSIPAPYWAASMKKTVEIAGQVFFK
jgi:N-acetylmuramoyl-L-alanine amidase